MTVEELSPEEQVRLEELNKNNPDKVPETYSLNISPEMEQTVLACCYGLPNYLETAVRLVPDPQAFMHGARQLIYRFARDYFLTYKTAPTLDQCKWHIEALAREEKLPGNQKEFFFVGELNTIKNEYEPNQAIAPWLLSELERFARNVAYRENYHREIDLVLKGEWEKLQEHRQSFKLPSVDAGEALESWDSVLKEADKQKEDWCIPNWCEYGCMTLLSSRPKAGKSTIMSQLIVSAMLGEDFYNMDLHAAPVLLIDPENRQKTLVRRLNHCLRGRDSGKFSQWFFRLGDFPKPLTMDLLVSQIAKVKAKTGSNKVIVIMDTLRSCFAGEIEDENDAAGMAQILTPLRDLAAKENICLFLIHHNNKGADDYSGSTAILSSVDYHWNYRNDKLKNRSEIACQGRGDVVDPLELTFDRETQTNRVYVAKEAPGNCQEPKENKVDLDIVAIPLEGCVGIEELMGAWGCSRATVKRRLDDYITAGEVMRRPRAKATDKVGFYRL